MDDFEVQLKAREFVRAAAPRVAPVPMKLYLDHIGAVLHVSDDLTSEEPGWSVVVRGKFQITVNGNDSLERQRFTICHEIAHYVLEIPSEHDATPLWSYSRRPPNEVFCDIFAAELLLPLPLFKPIVDSAEPGFASIERIRTDFESSLMATASRFAAVASIPCAFVLSEKGNIRFASRSASLRAAGAWIQPRSPIPKGSLTARIRTGETGGPPVEVDPDVWFVDWRTGGTLFEDARYLARWEQGLTLLWGDEDEIEAPRRIERVQGVQDPEYRELDGDLPWPGKRKRKK